MNVLLALALFCNITLFFSSLIKDEIILPKIKDTKIERQVDIILDSHIWFFFLFLNIFVLVFTLL